MKKYIFAALIAAAFVAGVFVGSYMAMKSAVPVGPAVHAGERGYIISYRYGDFWLNEFYSD